MAGLPGGTSALHSRQLDLDADGTPDETDNCRMRANPGQQAVTFDQEVTAADKTVFSWEVTADVRHVRGPLESVSGYATDQSGSLFDVVAYVDADLPAAGAGFYYLFRTGGSCAASSWQTSLGDEPARDVALPSD